jgi:ATP-dependent DNA helicase RecQ
MHAEVLVSPSTSSTAHAPNPLVSLTPTLLHLVTGDRRQQVISYLKQWEQHAALLRYLDVWLALTPTLATLRQARAEALLALGQPHTALLELDAIDQERGATTTRRRLRFDALLAAGEWEAAQAMISGPAERGDLLVAQGRHEEAKRVLADLAAWRDGPPTARDIRAALACGEPDRAALLLRERQAAREGTAPSVADLRLERAVALAQDDADAANEIDAALRTLEAAARDQLVTTLGLDKHADLEVVPDVPALEPAVEDVPPDVLAALQEHWGYDHLRGGQSATVARVLNGTSVLSVLPTGAGKSLTYQLPSLLLDGVTVVVSPLIALMKDQIDGLPPAVREQATAINSTMSGADVARRLRDIRAGRYKLVYVAPERLRQQSFVHALRETGIARFVVDEAHCVSLWGLSFRPDYLFLSRVLRELAEPPVLALTATATPETRTEITGQLGAMDLVAASVFRRNLHFSVVQVPNAEAKTSALIELCKEIRGPILVYARSRDRCEELAHLLRRKGIKASHYHAQVEDRARAQEIFMSGEVQVLVATVAFGMGIDKPDIRAIIHYNLPQSVEAYYQEAGRAGRDGKPSRCVLLYTTSDKAQLTSWLKQDTLDRDHLRSVYRALRAHAHNDYVLIAPEALQRAVRLDDTQVRVALGMLERVELVVRHFDLARTLRVTMLGTSEDDLWGRFVAITTLQPGQSRIVEPLAVAAALDIAPDQCEATLLGWSVSGLLQIDNGPRDWLLQLLPAPPDTPARIEALLGEYSARQDARVEAMVAYAKGLLCRHQALAAHFGERLQSCGDACDVCAGDAETTRRRTHKATASNAISPKDERTATTTTLRMLRDLPFSVGKTGAVRILNGSVESSIGPDRCPDWGALSTWTKTATGRLIDTLVEQGYLDRNMDGAYPTLELTAKGRQAVEGSGQRNER